MSLIASMSLALMATNSGTLPLDFDLAYNGTQPIVVNAGARHGFEKGSTPRESRFFADVPGGTYRVTLRIGSGTAPAQTTVKAEARRLMLPAMFDDKVVVANYAKSGPTHAPSAFAQNGEDHTHNDNHGAWLMASAVVRGIREKSPEPAAHLNAGRFDPQPPPTEAQVAIVLSQALPSPAPAGNRCDEA